MSLAVNSSNVVHNGLEPEMWEAAMRANAIKLYQIARMATSYRAKASQCMLLDRHNIGLVQCAG